MKGLLARFEAFWLRVLFWWARHAPWGPRLVRPLFVHGTWAVAGPVRHAVRSNLRHILGPQTSPRQLDRTGRAVIESFYNFVLEVGGAHRQSLEALQQRIASIDGKESYLAARQHKRGAILVTAHFGNFEVGLAAMRQIEPRVHVVFQRDRMTGFERVRADLHQTLGIVETPIDDGMASWLALRDALEADAVVLLQGDRVMPGQKGRAVPFCGGTLMLPVGPAKLALMTGAPLIPVFAVQERGGRVRIKLGQPIHIATTEDVGPALAAMGQAIEAIVRENPAQWHVLYHAIAPL